MAVKVSSLWAKDKFEDFDSDAKLLYLYLLTNPQLNKLGVIMYRATPFGRALSFDKRRLREATKTLIWAKYIEVEKFDDSVYFIVKGVFSPNIKSEVVLLQLQDILDSYPKELVQHLEGMGIKLSLRVEAFKIPTGKEVSDYARSIGYDVDGSEFVYYYNSSSEKRLDGKWQDGRGKIITDWKAKLRRVWCKEERKIKVIEGCPKGMESLSINFLDKDYYPESWENGIPKHSDFGVSKLLQKEFNKIKI